MRIKYFSFLILFTTFSFTAFSQSTWTIVNANAIDQNAYGERTIVPNAYVTASLDLNKFSKSLKKSANDMRNNDLNTQTIELPLPDGTLHTFSVWYSPVMHPNLAAKYPSLKSYRILSTTDKYMAGRISAEGSNYRISLRHKQGEIYIDPFASNSNDLYISYFTKDHQAPADYPTGACGVDFEPSDVKEYFASSSLNKSNEDSYLKKYRFALACTGEWGQNFSSVEQVLGRMVTATNRINLSLENEASVFFEMVENNDELIFMDPNSDPYTISNSPAEHAGREVLGQNTTVINQVIGGSNYDVGHVFTRSCTDGIAGVASLGSVCTSGGKGSGLSCVGGADIVNFMVQTTLHELGHQFGASHSWSNCSDNVNENLSAGTAYEPGSGSTFMSYAGSCSQTNNVQNSADPYFHIASMMQMYSLISGGNGNLCGEDIDVGNTRPVVTLDYPNDFAIPVYTPFELTGEAYDNEDDPLTYCWEQHNKGPISIMGNPQGNAPAFRSFSPEESNTRVFPKMYKILGNVTEKSEVLQTVGRDFEFFFTARDNHPGGGTAAWDKVNFRSVSTAGPFFVTAPNIDEQLVIGEEFSFQWEVANTDVSPVNCKGVDIILSTNGGSDFDIILAENVENDGEHTLVVPNYPTNAGRIKIKASENIFFDVSNFNFDINPPTQPSFYFAMSEFKVDVCAPEVLVLDISTESFLDFSNDLSFELDTDLPEETIISLSETSLTPGQVNPTLTLDFSNVNATGNYTLDIIGSAVDADTLIQTLQVTLTSGNFDDLALISPNPDVSGISELPTFEWANTLNAESYTLEYGLNPALGETGTIVQGLTNPNYTPSINLEKNSLYYWRVYAENKCANDITKIQMFATESLSCRSAEAEDLPIVISQSSTPTIESALFFSGAGQVTDINVSNIEGKHENVKNLRMTLISPKGTDVILIEGECAFNQDFNCGFDDAASGEPICPLTQGLKYLPVEPLSEFNGEDILGDWILRVEDTQTGDGGRLNSFSLEVCSNAVLEGPEIVTNEKLGVPTNGANRLNADLLLTIDGNNTAEELIYTVVVLPLHGSMTVSGEPVVIGTTFSQQDIADNKVRYQHGSNSETTDSFFFTVIDGEGGWINLTEYVIDIGDFASSTTDTEFDYFSMDVYPNPANTQMTININTEVAGDYQIAIYDITGKQVHSNTQYVVDNLAYSLDATQFAEGMLIVKLQNNKHQVISLTTIQR